MTRFNVLIIAGFVAAGCSGQNREGPNVTCADLGGGATNACEQGIIASCSGGEVGYRVCDDKDACGASWQTAGRYRCEQTESLPDVEGPRGSGGSVGGSSGKDTRAPDAGGVGGTAGSRASDAGTDGGGSGKTGSTTSDAGAACGVADICTIATNDSGYGIQGLALDDDTVYFVDGCGAVKGVPKVGGFLTDIAGPEPGSGCMNLPAAVAVTGGYVFVASPSDNDVRVFKGSKRVESYPGGSAGLAADADAAYWNEGQDLRRYAVSTGTLDMFATGGFSGRGLVAGAADLFWITTDGTALQRIAKNAGATDAPASVSLAPASAAELAVDGSTVYFVDRNGGKLGKIDDSGAVTAFIEGLAVPTHVALNAKHVFWTDGDGLHAVPKDGGKSVMLGGRAGGSFVYEANAITADAKFAFVADRTEIRRVPMP